MGHKGIVRLRCECISQCQWGNPMVINMAISDWISRGVSRYLSADSKVEEPYLKVQYTGDD